MGHKDEYALIERFRDMGFGAFRYAQPAINIPIKRGGDFRTGTDVYRQKTEYRKVARKQPVDFIVSGRVLFEGRPYDIRLGVEQKTCSEDVFRTSIIDTENHCRFVKFCRENLLAPIYIIVFRWQMAKYLATLDVHVLPDKLYKSDSTDDFGVMVENIVRQYITMSDTGRLAFDTIVLEDVVKKKVSIHDFFKDDESGDVVNG